MRKPADGPTEEASVTGGGDRAHTGSGVRGTDRGEGKNGDGKEGDGKERVTRCGRVYARRDLVRLLADDRGRLERRDLAKVLATIGGLTAVGSLAAPLVSLTRVFEREYTGPIYSDSVPLVDADGERIGENRLEMGERLTVFPETNPGIEQAPTLLVRFPEERYGGETNLAATVSGYAAYSKVCTHAGCMVSNVEDATLVCPCHYGKFDPLRGAVVTAGPPPRPLPQLPITLSADGFLIATGDFEGPVGVAEG